MKVNLHSTSADVTLTAIEAQIVRSGAVPMIYSPGGMGLDGYPPPEGGTVRFGGACFVNVEANLRASVEAFQQAVKAVLDEADAYHAGFNAFPAGQWMDALRGSKSFPKHARCPFKKPERIAAWQHGYADAHAEFSEVV